jgi:hypothetical protein
MPRGTFQRSALLPAYIFRVDKILGQVALVEDYSS